jgi:predicted nucleic acid-binding protein
MGHKYLMDSNVIIDQLGNNLPSKASSFIDSLPVVISVITRIEIVGWYNATNQQIEKLKTFVGSAFIYPLSEDVIEQTINIRQNHKIKLPDAIIAATALVNNCALITHNVSDYKGIQSLTLIDSWNIN